MIEPEAFEALLQELEQTADYYWNVGRDNAVLLSMLIKSTGAKRVLEVGTSNGYSTLWFARALEENGGGSVTAIEYDGGRATLARENYKRAGLDNIITLLQGDAREIIRQQAGPFDFVFLDADKPQYADYLRAVLPLVRSGGLIVGDDTISLKEHMGEYIELAFSSPELESVEVPIDDGIIISYKK